MLKSLQFEATFASTNRTIKGEHLFEMGMTAISGANETGKSMRLEMIRYALFGTAALRSALASYSTLWARLKFEIGGHGYEVYRNGSQVKLKRDHAELAAGSKPVNEAIIKLFGYDMTVFDSANACLQGEVEALTNKTPAERKRMVDRTIGLYAIDDLYKDYSVEMSSLNKTLTSLKSIQGNAPERPTQPENYAHSRDLEKTIKTFDDEVRLIEQKEAELRAVKCEKPVEVIRTVNESVEDLKAHLDYLQSKTTELTTLQNSLKSIPKVNLIDRKIERQKLEAYLEAGMPDKWQSYEAYNSRSKILQSRCLCISLEELMNIETSFEVHERILKIKKLQEGHTVECPNCQHNFHLDHSEIDKLTNEIKNTPQEEVTRCLVLASQNGIKNKIDLERARHALLEWVEFCKLPEVTKPEGEFYGAEVTVKAEIALINADLSQVVLYEQLLTKVDALRAELSASEPLSVVSMRYQTRVSEDRLLEEYSRQSTLYLQYKTRLDKYQEQIANKLGLQTQLESLRIRSQASRNYEYALHNYTLACESWQKMNEEIALYETKLDTFTKVRKALADIKPKVKSYLIPSLSRVASNFLSEMTNSQRNRVDISDEFEITVDGQPVETLSGSGKAVANLAVRLGLGTVLTNKVFSVLLADEIDASMDDERSRHTAACLRNLTKVFSQIILVSHHKAEADHHITL